MIGAELLARTFGGYGVTAAFFVPTMLSDTLYHLEKHTDVDRVLTHGEKAAAYMADGYARASGRPGICFAQMVGSANLAAGLRDAYLACSPVIAITGGPFPEKRDRNAYQENDDLSMFKAVTKSSVRVDTADQLSNAIRQAFRTATSGKPGPVHLEFAGHFGELIDLAEAGSEVIVDEQFSSVPPFRPAAEPAAVEQAAQLLSQASRPIIVAGGGVRSSGARAELRAVAERLRVPVATSLAAKDVLPGGHPLNAGVVGLYSRESANRAVLEADLVFFVGSKTGSQVTYDWRIPPAGTTVIQLDIDPEELGRNYPNSVSLLGDAKATLESLARTGPPAGARREEWVERVRELVDNWRAEWAEQLSSTAEPIRPERLCRELTETLPGDAVVMADTGHSGMWTSAMMDLEENQRYIKAAGSLGWGFPASIGAKIALPDRPVVLFTGDGGFYYHLSELETAVRWNTATITVVNNNRSLNQEVEVFEPAYGGELHGRHEELWHFSEVDFAKVAESLGATGIRVTKPDELPSAIERALEQSGPTVIDVVTDITAMAPLAFVDESAGLVEA